MRKSPGTCIFFVLIMAGSFLQSCAILSQTSNKKPQIQSTRQESISAIPTEKSTEPQSSANIYLIALEDNGKSGPVVGCGDSLIAVDTQAKDPLTALQMVLENHNQWYGQSGLYNALYQSDLKIERFESKGGKTEVDLTGILKLGGVCDNPRVEDQLKAAIRQSSTDNSPVTIKINGIPLEEVLSQK